MANMAADIGDVPKKRGRKPGTIGKKGAKMPAAKKGGKQKGFPPKGKMFGGY